MSSRRGGPLKDRPVVSGPTWQQPGQQGRQRSDTGESRGADASDRHRRRHCWVTHPDHVAELEGLVLQWASEPGGWVALTTYVLERPGGAPAVQEWLPATRLRPA